MIIIKIISTIKMRKKIIKDNNIIKNNAMNNEFNL